MKPTTKTILGIGLALAVLLYPLLVYVGLQNFSPRWVALLVGAVLLARLLATRGNRVRLRVLLPLVLILASCGAGFLLDREVFVLLVPVLINGSLLVSFALTLWRPPSMIEVFARMQVSELSEAEVAYCRSVTAIWCGFFLVNGTIAALTSYWGDLWWWSLYNGLLAYIAIGALFAAELVYRYWRFRRYEGLPTDFLFRRIFPPRANG